MKAYYGNTYNYVTVLVKAAGTVAIATLAAEVARMDLPTTIDEWKARGGQMLFILLLAVGRALQNAWKNRDMKGSPFYNITRAWMLFLLIPALTMQGCLTAAPALAGKTHYDMEFIDKTAEQDTQFRVNIAAPAGVEVANLASMNYRWNPDGSGAIAVAGDTTADTTVQAATISEVNRQQAEAFMAFIALLPALAPLIQAFRPPQPAPVVTPDPVPAP